MHRFIVTGCGTNVGKTIASAILTTALQGDYWKPIQCGDIEHSDTDVVQKLATLKSGRVHPPQYLFKTPVSPHQAAKLEQIVIDPDLLIPPPTQVLIIETVGGILVPINNLQLTVDLFKQWKGKWIIVSQLYVGGINHTLLTVEALKNRGVELHSIIFNGEPNPDSEQAILYFSKLPCLGRIFPEKKWTRSIVKKYATQWKKQFQL